MNNSQTGVLGLFPGQGSQKVGMGKDLFDNYELARKMFSIADEVLGFKLSDICFNGPAERLTETEVTQPAILTVSSICHALWENEVQERPQILAAAGHSLGEYSALVAAGALRFEDAVMLVHKRGKFMQEAVPAGVGKMVAVLGKELEELEAALKEIDGVAQIANINAPGQIVVAGEATAIDSFVKALGEAKVKELAVSAPFHCDLMKPAQNKLADELANTTINRASFPVYANYHAKAISEPEDIREALKLQVCGQVRWVESMQNCIAEHKPEASIEFGAGNVLSGMLKRIDSSLSRSAISTPASIAKLVA